MSEDNDELSSSAAATTPTEDIPVVGVGASAGGLAAFKALLRELPTDTGMAFVLIQHLDPTHSSLLVELLAKDCPMPIPLASDGLQVAPNQVYAIAPGQQLSLLHNRLVVMPEGGQQARTYNLVDLFFSSLADKLYRKKSVATGPLNAMAMQAKAPRDEPARASPSGSEHRVYDLGREIERRLLERYAPGVNWCQGYLFGRPSDPMMD